MIRFIDKKSRRTLFIEDDEGNIVETIPPGNELAGTEERTSKVPEDDDDEKEEDDSCL